jgi:hypothetical protein
MAEQPDSSGPSAIELVRAQLVGDELRCTVVNPFDDPSLWGVVLADLARVVAQKFQEHEGKDPDATLRSIRDAFEQTLSEPAPTEGLND